MSPDPELLFRPAGELAALVRNGELQARELVEASLARIEALNGRLNAFIHLDADGALAAADAIGAGDERPFAGVPIAIKDIGPPWGGHPLTFGSQLFGDFTPDFDGAVVRRLKDAGFIPVGKTNAPEMGILPVTEPRRYGPTRNPWDPERTPGGSSGGSACATAAGMVPIAHANDGGGSIRTPAACCGLVGLKAARGRVSPAPLLGESFLTIDGVVSRTVEDTARVLDVLAGYELGDASWAQEPAEPFAHAIGREPGKLCIGLSTKPPIEADVDPVCVQATHDAAELLRSLGHDVEEFEAPWASSELFGVFSVLWAVVIGMSVEFGAQVSGQEPSQELLEPLTWDLYQRAKEIGALEHSRAVVTLQAFSRAGIAATAGYDAVLTPALAERPVPIGTIDAEQGWPSFGRSGQFTPFTAIANLTGQPAISVPLFHGDDGLPLAVQLVGRPAGEAGLLTLAAQLERERPWADRRPPGLD